MAKRQQPTTRSSQPGQGASPRPSKARTTTSETTTPSRRRMDIELLRVVAVLSVTIFHFAPGALLLPGRYVLLPRGYLGVDIFFTISGFVITAQMLRAHSKNEFTYLGFIASRVRRLLPTAVFVIVVSMLVIVFVSNPLTAASESRAATAALLYVENFFFAERLVDYFAQGTAQSSFIHFWSLSVEEQFYVFWPIAFIAIAWVVRNRSAKRFAQALGAFALVVGIASFIGAGLALASDPDRAFFMPWWRAYQLMAGAAVAIALHAWKPDPERIPRLGRAIISWVRIASVVALLVIVTVPETGKAGTGRLNSMVWLPVVIVLATAWAADRDVLTRLGALKPLAWIAATSYVIYIWHWPVWLFTRDRVSATTNPYATIAVALAITLVFSALTRRYIEIPIHRGQRFVALPNGRVVAAGLGTSIAVALAMFFGTPVVASLLPSGQFASSLTPPLQVAFNDRAPAFFTDCFEKVDQSEPLKPCIDNPGLAKTTMLLGDSHAAQWQGVLAQTTKAAGSKLITSTRSGCPVWNLRSAYLNSRTADYCDEWRSKAIDLVKKEKPDLLILSTYASPIFIDPSTGQQPLPQERNAQLARGMQETLETLRPEVGAIVVLEDTPQFIGVASDPLKCLADAQQGTDCQFPNDLNNPDRVLLRQVTNSVRGAQLANPYPQVCPDIFCQVVEGNRIKYFDQLHLSNSYAKTLAPWVDTWLRPNLGKATKAKS